MILPEFEPLDERPADTRRWFNTAAQAWVVQLVNAAGDQLGEATYIGVRGGGKALAEAHERELREAHNLPVKGGAR